MLTPRPFRVFLASPGDLDAERQVIRDEVTAYNGLPDRKTPEIALVGWEHISGTTVRPQSEINRFVESCDFMIVMFKERWGSNPGGQTGYSSGTEEELFTGLLALGRPESPMRDIWVAFMPGREPEDQVRALRHSMEEHHALLYENPSNPADLKERLGRRLRGWANSEAKVVRAVNLLPASGLDVLGAQTARLEGERLISLGVVDLGIARLERAVDLGGSGELLALAKHLARVGRIDEALERTARAIEVATAHHGALWDIHTAEVFAAHARLLRQASEPLEAIEKLKAALHMLPESEDAAIVRARILDDLGLAEKAMGRPFTAIEHFSESLELRRNSGSPADVAQSLINMARAEVALQNLDEAHGLAREAEQLLTGDLPSLRANCAVLLAQISIRQSDATSALSHAERARAINRNTGNQRGEAISLRLMAQAARSLGNSADERTWAQQCLELNQGIRDAKGEEKAAWLVQRAEES